VFEQPALQVFALHAGIAFITVLNPGFIAPIRAETEARNGSSNS